MYNNFCETLKSEMNCLLKSKAVLLSYATQTTKKRLKKNNNNPWWNEELPDLWNGMCTEVRKWLKAKGNGRKTQRLIFLSKRKRFYKQVQKCKRKYWIKTQTELEDQCKNDNDQFWKSVGRLGIGFERQNKIPMEIMKEVGSLSSKPHGVMAKMERLFSVSSQPAERIRTESGK